MAPHGFEDRSLAPYFQGYERSSSDFWATCSPSALPSATGGQRGCICELAHPRCPTCKHVNGVALNLTGILRWLSQESPKFRRVPSDCDRRHGIGSEISGI